MIIDAKIFRIFDVEKVPFYRRLAQYLAAAMVAAGFNEKEAVTALNKLQNLSRRIGFADEITKSYLASETYQKSVSKLSGKLRGQSSTTEINWTPPS